MNMQPETAAAIRWVLRGVEKAGDAFVDIPIVGTTETAQGVTLSGSPAYTIVPMTDTPTAPPIRKMRSGSIIDVRESTAVDTSSS